MRLRPGEMPLMQQMVRQLAGVALDESKGYLIESRLGRLAEQAGCTTFNELYFKFRYGRDTEFNQRLVDAITTHETTFFRDAAPFDALQHRLLPDVIAARERLGQGRRLRIWSAACSTGQEPYSIGMVVHEVLRDLTGWDVQILATDISKPTLEAAARGVYSDLEMSRSARPALMAKYFSRTPAGHVVAEHVKKLVTFRELNLAAPLTGHGPFDIVFLRNVLIYFDAALRRETVQRVAATLCPHGYLLVGASETLADAAPGFVPDTHLRATFYRPDAKPLLRR